MKLHAILILFLFFDGKEVEDSPNCLINKVALNIKSMSIVEEKRCGI